MLYHLNKGNAIDPIVYTNIAHKFSLERGLTDLHSPIWKMDKELYYHHHHKMFRFSIIFYGTIYSRLV